MRRRSRYLLLPAVTVVCVGVAWWLWSGILGPYPFGPPHPPPLKPRLAPAAEKLYATTLPVLEIPRMAFADALDIVRERSDATIFVNWRALSARGVSKDAPVALRTPATDLASVVRHLLDEVQAAHPGLRLDFCEDQGVLTISTHSDLAVNVVTKVYDVRDILDPTRILSPRAVGRSFSGKALSPSGTSWRIDNLFRPRFNGSTAPLQITALARDVESTVDPSSWRATGGNAPRPQAISGQLIITQTPENQAEIVYFLQYRRWQSGVAVFAARTAVLVFMALLLTSLLLIVLHLKKRGQRRLALGRCPTCDYDLRATPVRCPECGWSASPGAC